MSSYQVTSFATTTATAVAFAYATAVTMHSFTMWSSPAVNHANKRFTRQPSGVVN